MQRHRTAGQISDPDIKLLRVFKCVVESQGFSAAEADLNIGRSAISRMMGDLETRLNVRLCHRGRSGFQLTPDGERIYRATLTLFNDMAKFRAQVETVQEHLAGDLTLGIVDNTITDPNAPHIDVISHFHQYAPNVTITLRIGSPNEVERWVLSGHTAIGIIPLHHRLSGLLYQSLYHETSQLYCSEHHPLFAVDHYTLSPEELTPYSFISAGYAHAAEPKERFPELSINAVSYQVEGIAMLILSGQFLGFLPTHYAAQWVEKNQMRALLPQHYHYQIPFGIITSRDAQPNRLRDTFTRALATRQPLTGNL